MSAILGFNAGSLPFNYLGVPLFRGKPRRLHLQHIADKIIAKLATWKGLSLSIMGRVELVKSVIQSMLAYSFHIYAWPASLIKSLDGCIRNFIWSGNTKTRKLVTVAWKKVCSPSKFGGLGLRSIKKMNQAAILKLAWVMKSSDKAWALFCRARFGSESCLNKRYFKSSIWHGIKANWSKVTQNSMWLVGDGGKINFWKDNWLGVALMDTLNIPASIHSSLVARVADFVINSVWTIHRLIVETFPNVVEDIVQISTSRVKDKLIWQGTCDGIFSLKAAFRCIRPDVEDNNW
ncbi:hypothetical protein Lalb_Chr12g0209791 [Lupinus albus]|uniref:Reverse transcriptase zinc-binding domain-containing protein n=1 Tax=Lupinus albus TaxID=3870 RepID=A0A6A4PPG8_LUPAL|nr:hypothetical protein Lalb_Chr12g0209791 [Lupinus albus]